MTVPARTPGAPLDVGDSIKAVRRCFEAVSLYGVTQLAQWLARPDFERTAASATDMEVEEPGEVMMVGAGSVEKEKAAMRQSMSMAERFRRGLMGEMALDFHTMLLKAKMVVPKANRALGTSTAPGPDAKEVDLTAVLDQFVQERISVQS